MASNKLVRRQLAQQLAIGYVLDLLNDDDGLAEYLAAEGLSAAEAAEGRAEVGRLVKALSQRLPADLRGR